MTNKDIQRILLEKEVAHLYHANSMATACTFLENGGLLSRGAVEDFGLYQTPQETDATDKLLDVYYDIFFDSVDIHERIGKINHYGPIVFVYSTDVLETLPEGTIQITKYNPIRWFPNTPENKRYFSSEEELYFGYTKGDFTQHITLRHQTEALPFDYLEKIIIDNPMIDNTSYFENAYCHLQFLIEKYAPWICLEIRQCPLGCSCHQQYRSYKEGYVYHKFHF